MRSYREVINHSMKEKNKKNFFKNIVVGRIGGFGSYIRERQKKDSD